MSTSPIIQSQLELGRFERVHMKGASRPVGWVTRDMLHPEKVRNLILFSGSYRDLLSPKQLELLGCVADSIRQIQEQEGLLKTGAVKHLVNQLFEGHPNFTKDSGVTVALYKFGPVPVMVFDTFQDFRLAVYPYFRTDEKVKRAYPSDRYSKLIAYKNCGLDLLFGHYFEHVGARFHDIEWFRSIPDSISECVKIRREIEESVFTKLYDVEQAVQPSDPITDGIADSLVEENSRALYQARFASYFALHLVTRFFRLLGMHPSEWDYDDRIARIKNAASGLVNQGDENLKYLLQGWEAFVSGGEKKLRELENGPVSEWVRHFLSFSRFLLGLEERISEFRAAGENHQLPGCFAAFHFDAQTAPLTVRILERLPIELGNRRVPLNIVIGTARAGEDLEDIIRQKLFLSELVVPFIPSREEGAGARDYDWIIKEVEHGRLLKKKTIPAVAVNDDMDMVLAQVSKHKGDWFSKDSRVCDERRTVVEDALKSTYLRYRDIGPHAVDENLLKGLRDQTLEVNGERIRSFLTQFLALMDEPVRRWTIFVILATLRYPDKKGSLTRRMKLHGLTRIADRFDRLRMLQNRRKLTMGDQICPLVEFNLRIKKYRSNLERLMSRMGCSSTSLNPAELSTVRTEIVQDLERMLGRSVVI